MMLRCAAAGITILVLVLGGPLPAAAEQLGQIGGITGAVKKANDVRDLQVTDAEEQQLGAAVSEKIRTRYGVVQDATVHRYVALVGTALAQASTRPALPWNFIVLDTDGVNAFAAPGGYVHITRGALALLETEAELAGVLGHEIIHVTEKHTIKSIQKSKAVQMGASETLSGSSALLERAVTATYDNIVERGFGREEENDSDEKGIALANKVGYAPDGLGAFLTRLKERNKDSTEKRGLFASHPEMDSRLANIKKEIAARKLASTATLGDRYKKFISYTPKPMTEIATVTPGSAGLTGDTAKTEPKKEEPKKKSGGFGLSRMLPTGGGGEKQQAQVTGSGSARGVDPEKDSRGGGNPALVAVKLAAADIEAFKKEGGLK
jgi:beta-barrel assembly-enhancing protease